MVLFGLPHFAKSNAGPAAAATHVSVVPFPSPRVSGHL